MKWRTLKIIIAVIKQSAKLLFSITSKKISDTIIIVQTTPAAVVLKNLYYAFLMSSLKLIPKSLAPSEKFVY